ncbi:hypothetical protein BKA00_006358 [Actinomadura coerulea]|uniref:Uncharacterized protein n=1 Tax=Actinomadura coerulea TaxID=46159 RepID=A0A7X0G4U3_9ACTN|nr:hypothetical protein [Actinomadura coerulea]MBB6399444.1 hypothetical protein [Actinomadura coerulea]
MAAAPASAAAGDTADDARLVHCLSPAHQTELVNAAVALGLGERAAARTHIKVAGKATPLDAWRKQKPEAFDRACKALYEASKEGGSSGGGSGALSLSELVKILLAAAAGAVLTMLAGDWRSARDTGMLRADELRRAARQYGSAASEYAQAWVSYSAGPLPSDEAVGKAGAELDAQLRRYELLRKRWRAPTRLRTTLATAPLGDALGSGWGGTSSQDRASRSQDIDTALAEVRDGCEVLALALERPGRLHPEMKA